MARSTLLILTSDNGPLPTLKQKRCAGLRGSKTSLYEGGIRVPFLVRWPGQVPSGQVDDQTVLSAVDLLPTLCEIAHAKLPASLQADGEDMSRSFLGAPQLRRKPLFWEYGRNADYFHYPRAPNRSPNLAIREGKWKLLIQADGSGAELYDLAEDGRETRNIAQEHPQVVDRLSDAVLGWRKSLPAPPRQTTTIR